MQKWSGGFVAMNRGWWDMRQQHAKSCKNCIQYTIQSDILNIPPWEIHNTGQRTPLLAGSIRWRPEANEAQRHDTELQRLSSEGALPVLCSTAASNVAASKSQSWLLWAKKVNSSMMEAWKNIHECDAGSATPKLGTSSTGTNTVMAWVLLVFWFRSCTYLRTKGSNQPLRFRHRHPRMFDSCNSPFLFAHDATKRILVILWSILVDFTFLWTCHFNVQWDAVFVTGTIFGASLYMMPMHFRAGDTAGDARMCHMQHVMHKSDLRVVRQARFFVATGHVIRSLSSNNVQIWKAEQRSRARRKIQVCEMVGKPRIPCFSNDLWFRKLEK